MTLWIILTAMAALVAALLTVPLVRRQEARADARSATLAVLRDQLADVDVQLASGTIPPADAEGLRTEIKRRMLAAGHLAEDEPRPFAARALSGVAVALAVLVAGAAAALYTGMGRPELGGADIGAPAAEGAAAVAATGPVAADGTDPAASAAADAEVGRLVTGLEARLAEKPDDAEGWRMLGWSYFNLRRFPDAARSYAKAVALDPRGEGYQSAFGEALVQAADGQVTPDARAAFVRANVQDAGDARARYFLAIGKAQDGELNAAIDDWIKLLGDSAPDAPWVPQLRQIIEATAREAGVDVSARLAALRPPATGGATVASPAPPAIAAAAAAAAGPAAPAGVLPGPSREQVQAVQAMPPGAQQAMIRGMVDGLATKLAANPRDEAGWLRLMRARSVLGETAAAAKARDSALAAFKDDPAARARITAAAAEMAIR